MARDPNVYPIVVEFDKVPRKGALSNMVLPCTIGFPDMISANIWMQHAAGPEIRNMKITQPNVPDWAVWELVAEDMARQTFYLATLDAVVTRMRALGFMASEGRKLISDYPPPKVGESNTRKFGDTRFTLTRIKED